MGSPIDHKLSDSMSSLPPKEPTNDSPTSAKAEEQNAAPGTKTTKPPSSATNSPVTAADESKGRVSREMSPARPQVRATQNRNPSVTRSRRGSQDISPSRNGATPTSLLPSVPSAAAVQRALSATRVPHLQPSVSDPGTDSSRPDRNGTSRNEEPLQWPISPRLKSPPPNSRAAPPSSRKSDINLNQATAPKINTLSAPDLTRVAKLSVDLEEPQQTSSHRPGRGASTSSTLETVAEGSLPNTPLPTLETSSYNFKPILEPDAQTAEPKPANGSKENSIREGGESGAESSSGKSKSSKSDDRDTLKPSLTMTSSRPPSVATKRSFTTLNTSKYRAGAESSSRSMTVETETVSSIPQVSLGVSTSERGLSGRVEPGGSVRLKPSNETIRPKKEKKKAVRKPTSINAGTVSSKADIFEAKVASAVDEATSSDSDETFVYESNPPDSHGSRQLRHHSRTPSTTSMASQADGNSSRYRPSNKDGQQSVAGKRSMKFTNSAYNNNFDGETGSGSAKGSGRGALSTPRHHHIGRYGRGGHASLFDTDSPFTQAGRNAPGSKGSQVNASRLSRPSSPRVNGYRTGTPTRKGEIYDHDFDDDVADDERTPLVGSVRISRSRHARRPNSASLRQIEYFEQREHGFFSRLTACVIITLLVLLMLFGAAVFVITLTKPLMDVNVKALQNVLASEQEIMLDLKVQALNPNLFTLTVSDLNVDIFAKSGYVKSTAVPSIAGRSIILSEKRTFAKSRITGDEVAGTTLMAGGGVDEGTDPIEDPEADPRTMLLGRVYEFDSPLVFEASPFRRRSATSVGQIRLPKPGNKTEQGGTERWERVLQHTFELTVRGTIKYQLPLSSRFQSAQIQSSVTVRPNEAPDDGSAEQR